MAKPLHEYTFQEHLDAVFDANEALETTMNRLMDDAAQEHDLWVIRLQGEALAFHLHQIETALAARFEAGKDGAA